MKVFWFRYRLIESIAAPVLCLIICASCYIGFLQIVSRHFEMAQNTATQLYLSLRTQQQAIVHEKLVAQQLQQWKIKHADFYNTVGRLSTNDAVSKALSILLQRNGFSILAIKPIAITAQSLPSPLTQVEFTIQGSFQSLLSLFAVLNQFSYPVTLTALAIHRAAIFHIQLAWRI